MVDLSIVIPCFNEAPHLEGSVRELRQVMDQTRYSYELVFVDDGSQDRTVEILRSMAQGRDAVSLITHQANMGRGRAVVDGIRASRGRLVGFLDIDLEVHARYIPSMLAALEEGYDVATALRVYKLSLRSLFRGVLTQGYRWLSSRWLDLPLKDTETGFKFFRREAILPVLEETRDPGWFWDTEVMALAHRRGLRIIEIPCLFLRRPDKPSSVRLFRDTRIYLQRLYHFRARLQDS